MIHLVLHTPDTKVQLLLASALKGEYEIDLEPSDQNLRNIAAQSSTDVIVVDFDSNYSPLQHQLAFCDEISDSRVPIIVMTDDLRVSTAIEFLQRGAFDCVRKPPSLTELKVVIRRAYEHAQMKKELDLMRQTVHKFSCDHLVGSSGRAQVLYDLIGRVANLSASVLITGESGTGKELAARAIHNLGSRNRQPFVAVSCGAIPESLIEAELFGHEKGSFTGSIGTRIGHFEQAGEGTLFLDEIGELSLSTQVKLLRVLQEKEYSRVGSNRLIHLNARVLFATHRNLSEMVEAGTFRKDLFYRVNVMQLHVPPLRERTEDIPTLARHFLRKYAAEYEKPVDDIRPNAMEVLVDYEWPGNIRELENVIQGSVIRCDDTSICRADLPEHFLPVASGLQDDPESMNFEGLLRQYKVDLANRAVDDCHGNKTLAAQKLGVSRAYLHRLVRRAPGTEAFEISKSA